jgi:MinD superfamily P-loop ATPase
MYEAVNGEWFVSDTRFGPMVHARLGVAEENSGKLVTTVRREARGVAERSDRDLVIIDGSPGIGCPVIASVTGASMVLVVTEPTLSGLHDLDRVADLARRFGVPVAVCVNKSDINAGMTNRIENHARSRNLEVLDRIPYDPDVTRAQMAGLSVVECGEGPAALAIRNIWGSLRSLLPKPGGLIQIRMKG